MTHDNENSLHGTQFPEEKNNFPEYIPGKPPTTLRLFLHDSQREIGIPESMARADMYRNEVITLSGLTLRLMDETIRYGQQISREMNTAGKRMEEILSSKTLGNVYITMHTELASIGVSDPEIYAFFKKCVAAREQYFTESGEGDSSTGNRRMREDLKAEVTPPRWFVGNAREWQSFMAGHVRFDEYLLRRGVMQRGVGTQRLLRDQDLQNAFTRISFNPKFLPQWVHDSEIPDLELVEQEYANDVESFFRTYEEIGTLEALQIQAGEMYHDEYKKVLIYLSEQKSSVFSDIVDLPDLVNMLHATKGHTSTPLSPDEIRRVPVNEVFRKERTPDVTFDHTLNSILTDPSPYLMSDMFALWFERQLQDADIISGADQPIDDDLQNIFFSLLTDTEARTVTLMRHSGKKGIQDNKGYVRILDKMVPFLSVLPPEDISQIKEFLVNVNGKPIEWFIVNLANQIAVKKDAIGSNKSTKQAKRIMDEFRKFSLQWVRDNWQWTYDYLREHYAKVAWNKDEIPVFSQHMVALNANRPELVGELEQKIAEYQTT